MTKRICVLGFLCAWLAVDAHAADDSLLSSILRWC